MTLELVMCTLELVMCTRNVEFHIFIVKFGCGVKFVPTYCTILPYKLPSLFVFICIVPNKWYFFKYIIFIQ